MPEPSPASFRAVVDLWITSAALARQIGEKATNVRDWRARDNIPEKHWDRVITAAIGAGFDGVTYKRLTQIARAKRETTGRGAPASAPATE